MVRMIIKVNTHLKIYQIKKSANTFNDNNNNNNNNEDDDDKNYRINDATCDDVQRGEKQKSANTHRLQRVLYCRY